MQLYRSRPLIRTLRIQRLARPTPGFVTARSFLCTMAAPIDALKVHNTLSPGQPVPFRAIGKEITWYACGPTVYDKSHLGHARNYVSTDIIRRILKHYFGQDVKFVMNITDIDDKIIIRARRQRLLELEKKKSYSPTELAELGLKAFRAYAESNLPLLLKGSDAELSESNYSVRRDTAYGRVLSGGSLDGSGKPGDAEAKIKMHIGNMDAAQAAIETNSLYPGADEILLPYLDSLYKETIDTSDQTMFTDLTRKMEDLFFQDMHSLNVLDPDVITRVTEYVPQIVKFVERIVENGFAYEAEGSVYFDIAAFEKAGNQYARLRPESRNDKSLQEEGEGSLSKNLGGKRGPGDFALWKKSKKGEPYWPSPWSEGRPGWHIECSVMASDILGGEIDIHSGGIDLAFPHHDNELAQSEAYFFDPAKGERQWINYFLHMGHLSIAGAKMSKSLKNFQTIEDALATTYTSRSMRIVFLSGRWNDGVEISGDLRSFADNWEASVTNLFTNTKSLLAEAGIASGVGAISLKEADPASILSQRLSKAKEDMATALSRSFDTPAAMQVILSLIKEVNVHLKEQPTNPDLQAIEAIARWVTKMVGIFGLDENASPPYEGLGWTAAKLSVDEDPTKAVEQYALTHKAIVEDVRGLSLGIESIDVLLAQDATAEFQTLVQDGQREREQLALPYLRASSRLRDELRRQLAAVTPETKKAILSLTDRIRDHDLTNLGVYLDDRPDGQPSLIKFVPAAELIAAREQKAAQELEKQKQKEEVRKAREAAELEKLEKAKVNPKDMFKNDDRYSEWDSEGLPTKLKDGGDVPKSQLKKLQKEHQKQLKLYQDAVAKGLV